MWEGTLMSHASKLLIMLASVMLCFSCADNRDTSVCDFSSDVFERAAAEKVFTEHLDKFGELPPRFQVSSTIHENHTVDVRIYRWPLDGAWRSGVVDMKKEPPGVVGEIKYSNMPDETRAQPTTPVSGT